jgi:hypothetical protein
VDASKYVSLLEKHVVSWRFYTFECSYQKLGFLLIRVFVGEIRGFVGDFILSSVLTRNWAFWLLQRSVD